MPLFHRATAVAEHVAGEASANATAVIDVVQALAGATSSAEAIRIALDLVRERFG